MTARARRRAADLRAWTIITALITATYWAAHHTHTPTGYMRLTAITTLTALAMTAWARRKHLEETHR